MIPAMPNANATGHENNVSNPPRIASGLPHPGLKTTIAAMVTTGMQSRIADILPKRISRTFLQK